MYRSNICLTLMEKTIDADLALVEKWRGKIDAVELRADCLDDDELFSVHRFPRLAKIPAVLTIRRKSDGGFWTDSEMARTSIFARAVALAQGSQRDGFEYYDFEHDLDVSSIREAAIAFGVKIIRSIHDFSGDFDSLPRQIAAVRRSRFEIPKIAVLPKSLAQAKLFCEAVKNIDCEKIAVAMGEFGRPTRLLSSWLRSLFCYTCDTDLAAGNSALGMIGIGDLCEKYRFHRVCDTSPVFGIIGYPVSQSKGPAYHNARFAAAKNDAIYMAMPSTSLDDALAFAQSVGVRALSVTAPFKEAVVARLKSRSREVDEIGSCNTLLWRNGGWHGENTDVLGAIAMLQRLSGGSLQGKKCSIVGSGGVARTFVYAVSALGGKCCVFARNFATGNGLASRFGFEFAPLSFESDSIFKKYSDIVIQATTVGMRGGENDGCDPIPFFDLSGGEIVVDAIYSPPQTPLLSRAAKAGCRTENGAALFEVQAAKQAEFFSSLI